jgi:hypothetical protein
MHVFLAGFFLVVMVTVGFSGKGSALEVCECYARCWIDPTSGLQVCGCTPLCASLQVCDPVEYTDGVHQHCACFPSGLPENCLCVGGWYTSGANDFPNCLEAGGCVETYDGICRHLAVVMKGQWRIACDCDIGP